MKQRKVVYIFLSLLIVMGLLLSGCSQQATPASTAPASTTPSTSAADPIKEVKAAVNTFYYTAADNGSYLIAPDKAKAALDKNDGTYLVVDVRQASDYAKGHIKGAINVPYGVDIGAKLDKIRAAAKGKSVIAVCYSGQSAGQVTSLLNIAGIKALTLIYGMGDVNSGNGWLGAKYPVVTDPTPMPTVSAVDSPNKGIDQAVKNYFFKLPTDSNLIAGKDLHEKLAGDSGSYVLLDVRKAEDFAKGHIKGAVSYPYGPAIAQNLNTIADKTKGKTLVVYCYSGITAGQTVSLLNVAGIPAKSLLNGFDAGWGKLYQNEIEK